MSDHGGLAAFTAADLLDPPRVDAWTVLEFEPACLPRTAARDAGLPRSEWPEPCGLCPQERFHAATEFEVGYGGAAGGGKTLNLLMMAVKKCVEHPNLSAWCFRRSYPELRDSFIEELKKVGYCADLGAKWYEGRFDLDFANRSSIKFRYCEDKKDATRYQSSQMQLLCVDEVTLMDPEVVGMLEMRVRSGREDVPVIGVRYGTNPGGIGHGWFKGRFVDAGPPDTPIVDPAHPERPRRFIPAKIADNPYLDPGYEQRLDSNPGLSDATKAAFKEGSWDKFEGQFFPEWDRDVHVIRPFVVPDWWVRFRAVDYGYRKPMACLWIAVGPDREVYVYRELYGVGMVPSVQAQRIKELSKLPDGKDERIDYTVCDPSIWARTGIGDPVSQQYHQGGLRGLRPAMNARPDGWARVREYLRVHEVSGKPTIFVFDTCPNLIRTLPALVADPDKSEDCDTDGEDHAPDALRYGLMSRSRPSRRRKRREARTMEERVREHHMAKRKKDRDHPTLGRLR